MAKVINERLDKYFSDRKVKMISNFFAEEAFTLVANVHYINVENDDNGIKVFHYYITNSTYQSFNVCASAYFSFDVKTLEHVSSESWRKSILWGCVCDPNNC